MPAFSENSKSKLATADARLQLVMNKAIEFYDFSVVCGTRSKEAQDVAFSSGVSKVRYPHSKHNTLPSLAVDIYPYHPRYKSLTEDAIVIKRITEATGRTPTRARAFILEEYCMMAQAVKIAAKLVGVELRWGGDWDSDLDRLDQTFDDLAHFELVE